MSTRGGGNRRGDAELGGLGLFSPLSLASNSFLEGNTQLAFNLPLRRRVSDIAACVGGGGPRKGVADICDIHVVRIFVL